MTKPELAIQFQEGMLELDRQARIACPNIMVPLRVLLAASDGLTVAKRLINDRNPSDAFTKLVMARRKDLTVESYSLQPRWSALFEDDPDVLVQAQRRLDEIK